MIESAEVGEKCPNCGQNLQTFAPQNVGNTYRVPLICVIMVALCNRADHYIFMLWLLLSFFFLLFSLPNLSGRRLDVYHTSIHGVALVYI